MPFFITTFVQHKLKKIMTLIIIITVILIFLISLIFGCIDLLIDSLLFRGHSDNQILGFIIYTLIIVFLLF